MLGNSRTRRSAVRVLGCVAACLIGFSPSVSRSQSFPETGEPIVWPLPPEPTRIRYLYSFHSESDVKERPAWWKKVVDVLAGEERVGITLRKPFGVHADARGRVFVADTGWGRLIVFDPIAHQASLWGESGPGALDKPLGIASDRAGNIYVSDASQKRIVCFTPEGKFLRAYGMPGDLERPVGLEIDAAAGRLYVADNRLHQIVVFDIAKGKKLKAIGKRGSEAGQFNFPMDVALGDDGNLYVMDTFNFRVEVISLDGKEVKSIGQNCDKPGCFSRPKGVAFDKEGHLYVPDAAFNNVQIFSKEGEVLLFFGSMGASPGKFWLTAGIDIDDQDRIYVADQYNQRINVYQYVSQPDEQGPAPAAPADLQRKFELGPSESSGP